MEGVRTEELSGSNLHKWSNSSCKERTKNFSHCLLILYHYFFEMSILAKSLSLEFPTDYNGKTSLIVYLYYIKKKLKSQDYQSLYLWIFQRIAKVLLTYYLSVYGVPKIEKEVISFSIVSVSIILL